MAKQLSIVELAKLKQIASDPVTWAYHFLRSRNPATMKIEPWQARDYQKEMMRDSSLRKVYRLGRRCG